MGRMSEARKRARRKGDAGTGEPVSNPPAPAAAVTPAKAGGEADLVFADEPGETSSGRIELPASGTAEEILARAEAAALASVGPGSAETTPGAAPAEGELPSRASSISFFSAPAREERATVEATEHLATFFLDKEEYGVEVKLVQEIRRLTEITQVPRAPEFIRGVINLRGRIIPVVDLKKKLGLGEVQPTRAARIVVVKIQDRLVGMLVDGASQVLKVKVSSVEPAPDEVVEKGGDYIRGVAKTESRLIILVDLLRILVLEGREGGAPAGVA